MSYSSNEQVSALCKNLLDGRDYFDTSSSPTDADVEQFLSSGCSIIETRLSSWGYSVPITAGVVAYDWISDLNTLYAAGRAEMTRINVTLSPGERTRGQVFDQMFWDGLNRLREQDLTSAGVTRASTGQAYLYVGGISQAAKDTVESDTDRVKPRFHHDLFKFPDSNLPSSVDSDDD